MDNLYLVQKSITGSDVVIRVLSHCDVNLDTISSDVINAVINYFKDSIDSKYHGYINITDVDLCDIFVYTGALCIYYTPQLEYSIVIERQIINYSENIAPAIMLYRKQLRDKHIDSILNS